VKNNLIVVEHEYYSINISMVDCIAFKNGYHINYDLCLKKKCNLSDKEFKKILKENFYYIKFFDMNDFTNICYSKTFIYSDIKSLLEDNYFEFELRLSYLIKAMEKIYLN
jgi:hypothetical protein